MLLQFFPVDNHYDGRRPDILIATQCKLPRQKRHRICLAAACRPEIGAALAALLDNRFYDTLLKQARREKLRIAADNLLFFAIIIFILKIDVVAEDFEKPFRRKHALDHRFKLIERKRGNLVAIVHAPPGIEMLVRRADRAEPRFHAVGYACQRTIVEQVRNIAPITGCDLLVGIEYRRIGIGRILELDDAKRHAVDVKQNVGAAVFLLPVIDVFNGKLVYGAEDVFVGMLKVDKRDHTRKPALQNKLHTIDHPTINFMKRRKLALRTNKPHLIYNLTNIIFRQIRISLT